MGREIGVWRLTLARSMTVEPVVLPSNPASLDEATRLLPGGAYTTFRTFSGNRVIRFSDHLARLEETARLAGKPTNISQVSLQQALRQVFSTCSGGDKRVRIVLDLEQEPGEVFILMEPLVVPGPPAYEHGVKVVTRQMQRQNPKAKLTGFIEAASTVREHLPEGINEALMVGQDGLVLEGLSSNFFAVRNNVVWTADEGVLSGITRSMVIKVIHEFRIILQSEPVHYNELQTIDEAFLTSASRAVLPVSEIDGEPVGSGKPGPITQQLLKGYLDLVEAEAQIV
jgi:branched-chain amino acid aminotransferase